MDTILNKVVLLAFGILLCVSTNDISVYLVLVILVAICSAFVGFIYQKKTMHYLMFFACCLVGQFYPAAFYFLPVLFYDLCYYPFSVFWLVGLLAIIGKISPSIVVTIILGIITFLLCRMERKNTNLQKLYRKSQDDKTEMQLKLNSKNQELLEKCDTDMHLATMAERSRIAGEIHDNVGHLLTSSILQIGAILACNPSVEQVESLNTLQSTLSSGMDTIRESIHNLHDTARDLHDDIVKILNCKCECTLDYDIEEEPSKEIHICFLFAIKEALSNIHKHSNASKVQISLQEHPMFFQLEMKDNGSLQTVENQIGMGLKTMSQRVLALKGNFYISTDKGYKIFITIPKEGK